MLHSKSHRFFASLSYHSTRYNSYFSFKKKNVDFTQIKKIIFPLCIGSKNNPELKYNELHQSYLTAVVNQIKLYLHLNFTIVAVGTPFRYNDRKYIFPKNNRIINYNTDSLIPEYIEKELTWLQEASAFIKIQSEKFSINSQQVQIIPWHEYYNDPDFQTCSDLLHDVYHQKNLDKYNLSQQFSENFKKAIDHGSMKYVHRSVKHKLSNQEHLGFKQQVFLHEIEECAGVLKWLGGSKALQNAHNLSEEEMLKMYKKYDLFIASHNITDVKTAIKKEIHYQKKLLPFNEFDLVEALPTISEHSKVDKLQEHLKYITQFMIENHLFSKKQIEILDQFQDVNLKNTS